MSATRGAPAEAAELRWWATARGPDARRLLEELAYLACGLPLGALYLVIVLGGLALGAVLGTVWLGLPLLLVAGAGIWRCAELEREVCNRLLGAGISPLPPLPGRRDAPVWQRLSQRLRNLTFWRVVLLLTLRLPLTVLAVAVVALGVAGVGALLAVGIGALAGSQQGYVGPFALGPLLGLLLCLLALPVAVLTIAATDATAAAFRALTRALLITRLPAGAPVREALAESLGDRTLSIAYWLPEREAFVDERGRRVPLPEPGSERAWTAVDYGGQRVAAIIHDSSLEATPELVQAAAAAASLALDNERLKAALRARVEELRASRVRIVEASNSARRRLERDLHDGAQQQLVAMAVELRLLRNRLGENPDAAELVDRIDAKLAAALHDLRELARGIHPGILTDRGLGAALESLAGRAPLPMEVEIDLPTRPPASVEAVAYFVVAEALTNVLKYAQAELATVRARYDGDDIVVELEDNGVGGADERMGTGLQGLHDRVGALEGILTVISPTGEGTLVRARLPCRAERLVTEAHEDADRYG